MVGKKSYQQEGSSPPKQSDKRSTVDWGGKPGVCGKQQSMPESKWSGKGEAKCSRQHRPGRKGKKKKKKTILLRRRPRPSTQERGEDQESMARSGTETAESHDRWSSEKTSPEPVGEKCPGTDNTRKKPPMVGRPVTDGGTFLRKGAEHAASAKRGGSGAGEHTEESKSWLFWENSKTVAWGNSLE